MERVARRAIAAAGRGGVAGWTEGEKQHQHRSSATVISCVKIAHGAATDVKHASGADDASVDRAIDRALYNRQYIRDSLINDIVYLAPSASACLALSSTRFFLESCLALRACFWSSSAFSRFLSVFML